MAMIMAINISNDLSPLALSSFLFSALPITPSPILESPNPGRRLPFRVFKRKILWYTILVIHLTIERI